MVVTISLAVLEVRKMIQIGKGACLKPYTEEVTIRTRVHICLFPMLCLGSVPEAEVFRAGDGTWRRRKLTPL